MLYRVLVSLLLLLFLSPALVALHLAVAYPSLLAKTTIQFPRLRDDTPPNPHSLPRPLHPNRSANARFPDNNSGASLVTR